MSDLDPKQRSSSTSFSGNWQSAQASSTTAVSDDTPSLSVMMRARRSLVEAPERYWAVHRDLTRSGGGGGNGRPPAHIDPPPSDDESARPLLAVELHPAR